MRVYLIIVCVVLSFSLYGEELKPCEVVNYKQVIQYTIPPDKSFRSTWLTKREKKNVTRLLKKCIHTSAVCIAEANEGSSNWVSDKLIAPKDGDFDPVGRELIFALLQYVDKRNKEGVCIVAGNGFTQVIPWLGRSWVVTKTGIKQYKIDGPQFTTAMTPNSLYKALLKAHKEAVLDAKQGELEKEKKMETAQQMLESGSDPDFVSQLTGVPMESIRLLQRLNN